MAALFASNPNNVNRHSTVANAGWQRFENTAPSQTICPPTTRASMSTPSPRLTTPPSHRWLRQLPKAELHAHLSGSIRTATLRRLLARPENAHLRPRAHTLTARTLNQCFQLFPIIHHLISDSSTLRQLVLEILHDFADDNTVYLELRATPRSCHRFTAHGYLRTVVHAVYEFQTRYPEGMICRVVVSVSRHLSVEAAWHAVQVTQELMSEMDGTGMEGLIVGMELSGNPLKGEWIQFRQVFEQVRRRLQLPVSLHFAEVLNDDEAMEMLDFEPDRVGHAVKMSDKVARRLVEMGVGVEVCITSNLVTQSVPSVEEHPVVKTLIPVGHRFCLCTDDSGVFDTTLSKEYGRLVQAAKLSKSQVARIAYDGLNLMFCKDESVKRRAQSLFMRKLAEIGGVNISLDSTSSLNLSQGDMQNP